MIFLNKNKSHHTKRHRFNYFTPVLWCFLCLHLGACIAPQQSGTKSSNNEQCQTVCMQKFDSCAKSCKNSCSNCVASANTSSTINYTKYVHGELVQGGIITRDLKSYRDPLQCRKVSCNCSADLMICTQACTGIIRKVLKPVPPCT